ncbi:unnamed protein product [Allacma fusca]|uniref:Uncharacterized protein n=1 Tax=Allacma fusca TaxID=39272 RepID=A0A8J2K761_9HEXA|nr:unnamed protein product [Allacma fusca]
MWANIISQGSISKTAGKVDLIRRIGRLQSQRPLLLCTVRNVGTDLGTTSVSTNKLTKNRFGEYETGKEHPSIPQLWLLFPGMGSQCNAIPKELNNIEPFAESLNKSRKTLKQIGIDIDELLHPDNPSIYKCVRSAMMSQTVLQV